MILTVAEVAAELKTNKNYVYRLIKAGLLPAIKIGSMKVRRESLDKFITTYEGMDLTDTENIKAL